MGGERAIDDDGAGKAEGHGRLSWARDRLAQVVDDLMWRLREGLPGRDIRLRLLQVCFLAVRVLCVCLTDGSILALFFSPTAALAKHAHVEV